MRLATKITRIAFPEPSQGSPFLPGPVFAGPFHAAGDIGTSPFTYGRMHNPTWALYEQALGELEGGPAIVFSSGMAAVAAVFGVVLRPGEIVVLPSDSYFTTRKLASGFFEEMGLRVKLAPTANNAQREHLAGAKLLWLESPSNPGLDVCDIRELVALAHEAGALVAVDNTTATFLGQSPLGLGADFSVSSDTKAITGHSDLILGHVACGEGEWVERIRTWRTQFGSIPGPMEVWLAHRSLTTMDLRLRKQCSNAVAIAQYLAKRKDIIGLRYPGLPGDPSYAIASGQMELFGPLVSFVLPNRDHAQNFLKSCRLVYEATSFGSIHTTAERRARWGGDPISDGFIRLSVGCEDSDDLISDISQALDAAATR
jgi:cystathionine gamma-lyase